MSEPLGILCGPASTPSSYAFEATASRAKFLDQRMREGLSLSLRYLFDELNRHLPVNLADAEDFLEQLEKQQVSPLLFALYGDLVLAMDAGDLNRAEKLTQALMAAPVALTGLRILSLGIEMKEEDADRYVRYVNTDPEMPLELFSPSAESIAFSRERLEGAFVLLRRGDPELGAEIEALLREIILCAGSEDPAKLTFDGASSQLLWGAVLINANRRGDDLAMVQMLAHESAHNLLFGLTSEEAPLNNDTHERYASPLRDDPRPLDGIYHATFVLARMHRAVKRLLDGGVLSASQATRARADLESNAHLFFSSLKTLDDHADLTETGSAIIEGARAYMLSN